MTFSEWLISTLASGVLAGVLLGAAGLLARNLILTRLKASVQHEFDQKIARLRSELQRSEDELRDVRSTALHALSANQTAIDARRIAGIEAIWGAVLHLKLFSGIAAHLEVLNYGVVCDRIEKEPKLQQAMQLSFGLANAESANDQVKVAAADLARPWVSPMIWALYKAYWAAMDEMS